ncbi:MAG: MATE family efflux transporter [Breznakia sp.]
MKTVDQSTGRMTQGSVFRQILWFSFPLLLGNLFQQLYNTADSAMVGRFVGDSALAAVNASTPLINLLTSFFIGLGVGASVIIARYYGAQNDHEVYRSVHTTIALSFIISIITTLLGFFASPLLLEATNVAIEVRSEATLYLQIFFFGAFGFIVYNLGCGILRAVGDSKTPLYYLIVASIINVVLDFVFIVVFGMGVEGAAIATSIAQIVSAGLVLYSLIKVNAPYHVYPKQIKIHKDMFFQIIQIGLPSAIQNGIISFSNVIAQSNINNFGVYAMAGAGAYTKIDGFAILPLISFSNALTTFVSQNAGACKYDRVRKGAKVGMFLSFMCALLLSLIIFIFGAQLLQIFSKNPKVLAYGNLMIMLLVPGYCMLSISHNIAGILRGVGLTKVPMFILTFCWCIFRISWISITVNIFHDIRFVFLGWPTSWTLSAIILYIYYKKVHWLKEDKTRSHYESTSS